MERGCGVGRPARLALHQSAGPNPLSPQGDAGGKQQRAPAQHDGARGTDAEDTAGTRGEGVPPHDSASDSDGGLGEIAGSMYTEMPWARTQTEHDKTTQKTSRCRRLSPTHKAENAWKSAWSP